MLSWISRKLLTVYPDRYCGGPFEVSVPKMYGNAGSRVRVNGQFSEKLMSVSVSSHSDSIKVADTLD